MAIGKVRHQVILSLGHCGAKANEYIIGEFSGYGTDGDITTEQAVTDFIKEIPAARKEDFCDRCGGYIGTNPVREAVTVRRQAEYTRPESHTKEWDMPLSDFE